MKANLKLILGLLVCGFCPLVLPAREWTPVSWPVLTHYDRDHLYRIALPLGGIGTGTVSLGGRGELRDWEIMNVPAKNYSTVTTGNNAPFFAVCCRDSAQSRTRLLEGPLYPYEYLHYEGRPVNHHGFPRFGEASFDAAYPFGQVSLEDPDMPVSVRIRAFNPLIPANAGDSGLPVAVLAFEVTNETDEPLDVSVCGSMRNFIGMDGSRFRTDWKGDFIPVGADRNRNSYRESGPLRGVYFYSEGVDPSDPAYGTIALTTSSSGRISYRCSSVKDDWNKAVLDFWDDFSDDGLLQDRPFSGENDPMASLALEKHIEPRGREVYVFYLTWHFPNRKAWSKTVVGNYYSQFYADAWDAAEQIVPRIPELERETLLFVESFLSSTYPEAVKEAALYNLSTLRSQTVFRLPDGHLMGWEGVMDRFGSCAGSCTHVWNYETATPFLFGELACTMRDVEFNHALCEDGLMNFRAALPLSEAAKGRAAAADGQMGCILKIYREWQLCGEMSFLERYWERVKRALSYAWIPGGWDANRDGVMEGSQHNTMDVNYYGPNPQMGFWYLGALRAAEEMARAMNDLEFARSCRSLFESGSAWMDEHLFNGAYYEQQICDPGTFRPLDMQDPDCVLPEYQLGCGCLVDQLVGQYMAHICDLGYLADRGHIRTTLESVLRYNRVDDFQGLFNNMRSYVFGKERGLQMAAWPKGRLKVPFPYFSEVMTGFEYCAAVGMIYEGMVDEGVECIADIRARYDGLKRNPFSEPECGHHYARAMASWSAVLALSGFHYSAVERTMAFTATPGRYFWSNGYAWGVCDISPDTVRLTLRYGTLRLTRLKVGEQVVEPDSEIRLDAESPVAEIAL